MHLLPLTVFSSAPTPLVASAPDLAARVGFAQRVTPTGERAYGYFSVEAETLVATLGEQPADLALQRWLHEHDADEGENDDTPRTLPAQSAEAASVVEELFSEGHARVFCTCCNRNLARREVRLVHTARHGGAVRYRYLCSSDHLLLALSSAQIVAVAEYRAA